MLPQRVTVISAVARLSPYGELDSELTWNSRTSGKCRGRRAKGSRDIVRVREIAGVRADAPPAISRAVSIRAPRQSRLLVRDRDLLGELMLALALVRPYQVEFGAVGIREEFVVQVSIG